MADAARAVFDQEPEQVKKTSGAGDCADRGRSSGILFSASERSGKSYLQTDAPGYPGREKKNFYLTSSEDEVIDRAYHAVLKDHPGAFLDPQQGGCLPDHVSGRGLQPVFARIYLYGPGSSGDSGCHGAGISGNDCNDTGKCR